MAEVRYHFDEHMSHAAARERRRRGIDVETTTDAGLVKASDLEHLEHARRHGRVVVTLDADFAELHYHVETHSGIAYFPKGRRSIGQIVEILVLRHATYTAEEMVGRLEWL